MLALLVTVWFTLPSNQDIGHNCTGLLITCNEVNCDTVTVAETDLATVRLYWWDRWASSPYLFREKSVVGMEGQRDSLELPDGILATVYVTTTDSAGNESCPSNYITISGVVGVGSHPVKPRYYDIAGRRVEKPDKPGIYWEVRGRTHRKIVVLK